jgi:hypothetical protein
MIVAIMVSTEQGNVDDSSDSTSRSRFTSYPTSGTRQLDTDSDTGCEVNGREDREGGEDMASWAGQPAIKGSTESMRMILLTFSLIGLQCVPRICYCLSAFADEDFRFTWGIEMTCKSVANGTPFQI